jgi:glucokinase
MIIGIDLGGTNIRAGLIAGDKIIALQQSLLTQKESLPKTISQLKSVIKPLIQPGVRGIGIGVPSIVDTENGIVYDVVNIPSWKKVELKAILESEFNIPVFINNDVNCFVLGEHRFGLAKGYKSVVALALGTGLGGGIIINSTLYTGANCGAGEIGSLPYLDKNFEFYTSSMFFENCYSTSALQAHNDAKEGKKGSLQIWKEFGTHLGNVIKTVMYTYDPEVIVLGGSISKAYSFFESSMKETMQDFQFQLSLDRMKIFCSQTGNIALLGAATLVNIS